MAAFTEMYGNPWLASIQDLMCRTQKNLRFARKFSGNRSKSFFLNSADLQSTNFSIEKQDLCEDALENFKKELFADMEEKVEKNFEGVEEIKQRIGKLEVSFKFGRKIQENILVDVESFDLRVKKRIDSVKAKGFLNQTELQIVKDKLAAENQEKSEILHQKLRKIPKKNQDFSEIFSKIQDFPKDLLKKSKFSRFTQNQAEVSENISKTCENLKKTCRKRLRHLDKRSEYLSQVKVEDYLNKTFENLNESEDLTEESQKLRETSKKLRRSLSRIQENEQKLKEHNEQLQIFSLKDRISDEIREISQMENRVSSLMDRLGRLRQKKKKSNRKIENFTRININYMGESDEDSFSFTSPTPSPLNQRLHPVNSTKHTSKNFKFSGDTIHENPDEYERLSPEVDSQQLM
jgi:hypothetical protein